MSCKTCTECIPEKSMRTLNRRSFALLHFSHSAWILNLFILVFFVTWNSLLCLFSKTHTIVSCNIPKSTKKLHFFILFLFIILTFCANTNKNYSTTHSNNFNEFIDLTAVLLEFQNQNKPTYCRKENSNDWEHISVKFWEKIMLFYFKNFRHSWKKNKKIGIIFSKEKTLFFILLIIFCLFNFFSLNCILFYFIYEFKILMLIINSYTRRLSACLVLCCLV